MSTPTALADFAATGGMVVLTVRSDFLDRCAALPGISGRLSDCIQFVTTMGESGIRQAIEEPARLAGLRVEPGLTPSCVMCGVRLTRFRTCPTRWSRPGSDVRDVC